MTMIKELNDGKALYLIAKTLKEGKGRKNLKKGDRLISRSKSPTRNVELHGGSYRLKLWIRRGEECFRTSVSLLTRDLETAMRRRDRLEEALKR